MAPRIHLCAPLVVALLAIAGAFHAAAADVLVVVNTNDDGAGSLRQALADAADGDVITFALATPATIVLSSGQLVIDKSVAIIGPGADRLTIDAAFSSRVFLVQLTGADFATGTLFPVVRIEHLTITRGFAGASVADRGGGGVWNRATLTVEHCVFTENGADVGGAIMSGGDENSTEVSGSLTVRSSSFFMNYGGLGGGAIAVRHKQALPDIFGGPVNIVNSTFSNNLVAAAGSGTQILISSFDPGTRVRIDNSTFSDDNDVSGQSLIYHFGAGADGYSILEVANSIIASSRFGGAAIFTHGSAAVFLSRGHNLLATSVTPPPELAPTLADSDLVDAGARLDTLQLNGGSTPTHALPPGSPAIDGGAPGFDPTAFEPPLLHDQRGTAFARVSGGRIDIGAFEVQAGLPPAAVCPSSQGFWKNDIANWPVTVLALGTHQYVQSELLAMLAASKTATKAADASLLLAAQLIAAKLNVLRGSEDWMIATAIADADSVLAMAGGRLPLGVRPASTAGRMMVALAASLERYNRGELTPSCSTP